MTEYREGLTLKNSYVYNGRGEQVRRYTSPSTNLYSVYDDAGQWLGEYTGASGGGIAPKQLVIWLGDLPVGVLAGGGVPQALHDIEPDALGTPRAVIDPARGTDGVAVWAWDLAGEAFGDSAPDQDPDGDATDFVFDVRFPGLRYDNVTGLNYNYFRDYEPGTGRYVQSDPIGWTPASARMDMWGPGHSMPWIPQGWCASRRGALFAASSATIRASVSPGPKAGPIGSMTTRWGITGTIFRSTWVMSMRNVCVEN